ncbi:MAG: 5-(carboxyamino)imidazole ribonucleotide synthase [Myxococcaceae bacterium]|nr:5-(carboxyamino)imidazole ribonucleotide synthase [Myxococcaceae bacterium]
MMLGESLLHLNCEVVVLDPDAESPALARLPHVLTAGYDDDETLAELFERCDVVTFDSENIPFAPLQPYAAKLVPSLPVLQVSQDRAKEKSFLAAHRFPHVEHRIVGPTEDVAAAARGFGFPSIAKSGLGGYDGKGQYRLDGEADLRGLPPAPRGGWVLEERLALHTELSCIVARDGRGGELCFPVFENLHTHHILDLTVVPARVAPSLEDEARGIALSVARALGVVGLLTVEFFVGDGRAGPRRLYVNELAPRTHNSGHVTRQACTSSQFDALARILAGAPLAPPKLHPGAWCMGNLLGDVWLAQGRTGGALDLTAWERFPDVVDVFLYGKHQARANRKMGHFVVRADAPERAMERARAFRAALST